MSLRKSPTLTPAFLAANRRNARKSTGPRTPGGKSRSRLNSLRNGTRSPYFHALLNAMAYAPPHRVKEAAQLFLSPEAASQPLISNTVEFFCLVEGGVEIRCGRRGRGRRAEEGQRAKPESY